MSPPLIHLKVLLPFRVFVDKQEVASVVAQTPYGSFGLLPHRLDCAMMVTPGVLTYTMADGRDIYLAVDEGVLVKVGGDVLVSVRNAISGNDLGDLHAAVKRDFLTLDEQEKSVRAVMVKLESNLIRRLAAFPHG